jgi:hypothetical protein
MNKALLTLIAAGLFFYGLYELTAGIALLGLFAWLVLVFVCIAGATMRERKSEVVGYSRAVSLAKSPTHYTDTQWIELCDRYGWRCLACGKQRKLTADHVVSVYQGGSDDISNIQPLCKSCNSKKGARTIDYRGI